MECPNCKEEGGMITVCYNCGCDLQGYSIYKKIEFRFGYDERK